MWTEKENKLEKDFVFDDFNGAIVFINKVAAISEKKDHHPEIYNIYNKVNIKLSTHDMGDIVTEKDHDLASEIDKIK
ncbi:MAG: pterin-4-alpha-carbinolamine dehydratase [Flammeovirgaceae bacterium]|mgnify:CR=1 FL=1|nr:pterin-4-alpha-carbinolamine dehydratase [Flammeovirgaceae bacterium]MAS39145.1 pterin-4-alpha-carbinolamine dehydratase [Flammeovirgaceae bacterium]|tara:strand:+ start:182 stop:412 length:231 start_codon:yes stop_codon:yes gene_type:complete